MQSGGNFYVSITENKSKSPDKSQSDWKPMADALNIKIQDATLTSKGIVKLSSATDSASEAMAATPKSVKAAYDLASGKYSAQDATTAQKGIVQLSSATDSTSETMAATPKAVKSIADRVSTLNVKTVNSKSADANGNIQITSADTGSLPSGGTAVAAAKLATPRAIGGTNFDGTGNITPALCTAASKLQTARTIAGVSFDGQSNIAIPAGNVGAYTKAEVDSRVNAKATPNTASKSGNGWWKCGSTGLIIQWGIAANNGVGWRTVTLPIAFPSVCVVAVSTYDAQKRVADYIGLARTSRTEINIPTDHCNTNWIAIGY